MGNAGDGWALPTIIGGDFAGELTTLINPGTTESSAPIAAEISITRNLSGAIRSASGFFSPVTITGDMSGTLVANADGDTGTLGGMFDARIIVSGNMSGTMRARRDSNATTPRGEIVGDVWVRGNFTGAIIAEGGLSTSPHPPNYILINFNGRAPYDWDSDAFVRIGTTDYGPGDYPSARIYWVTNVRGDCNGSKSLNNFDIDPFTLLLTDRPTWDDTYPWLRDAAYFVGDLGNGSSPCAGDCQINNFDIDCFTALLVSGEPPPMCSTAP